MKCIRTLWLVSSAFYKDTNSIMRASLMTSSKPSYVSKSLSPNSGLVIFSVQILWAHNSVHSREAVGGSDRSGAPLIKDSENLLLGGAS